MFTYRKRKQSLLKELQSKNKTGQFVDRRFGEGDAEMTVEDKMLERFAREKQACSDTRTFC
jgi:nucleolar protein 14